MSENKEKIYYLKNRSDSIVSYQIPEENIYREFYPGETKSISFDELRKLSYQPGGKELVRDYLILGEKKVYDEIIGGKVEPEYFLTEPQIKDLILNGSEDQWLDTLDFAPEGVIELIKKYAVDIPMTDFNKMESLRKKTGFDAAKAIANLNEVKRDLEAEEESAKKPAERRVKTDEEGKPAGRRTTPKYKVVG